ncbi:hypothetical protein ACFOD4_08580 [Pseudoroseomonas globiformis]|uniref:Uncharacterized protein n=1 Tax=Teichococcus globiformis TaxID=2307229 RepID=A0ABV7FZR9_9PROT
MPDKVGWLLMELRVELRVEESSVLGALITEQRNEAALLERQRSVLLMLRVSGRTPDAGDQEFVAGQGSASLDAIQKRLIAGESWDHIRR